MRVLFLLVALGTTAAAQVRTPSPAHRAGDKALVHFGWSSPSAALLRDRPEAFADVPFDGVAFHLGTGRWLEAIAQTGVYDQPLLAFADRPWTAAEIGLGTLGGIAWPGIAQSYVIQHGQSFATLDWFDDAHWAVVADNARLVSQAVAETGARGVLFDPEYYDYASYNPWRYFPWAYPNHTFAQVEAQARLRGAEYVQALQSARPEMDVLALWWMSVVHAQAEANGSLEGSGYELMRGFLNGMLDGAAPGLTLVDGNEDTYYVDESRLVTRSYDDARYRATSLLDPAHRPAWQARHQVAVAVYADYPLGLDPAFDWGHAPDFQLDWFEHNVYHALLTTDRVAWLYDEEINWYDEPERGWARYVPPGAEARIARARAKLAAGEWLGFDLAKPDEHWYDPAVAADRVAAPEPALALPEPPRPDEPFTVRVAVPGGARFATLFVDGATVGTVSAAPFEVSVAGLPAGRHTVWARAQTGAYQHVTTPPVLFTVAPPVASDAPAEAPRLALALLSANPARGTVRFAATLPTPGPARLDVFDALGRRVATLLGGERAAGTHALALDTAALAPGVYAARLGAGRETQTVRFTVVH